MTPWNKGKIGQGLYSEYFFPCERCGQRVKRASRAKKVVCFDCKHKRKSEDDKKRSELQMNKIGIKT